MNANDVSTDRLVADLKTVARDTEELLKASAGEVRDEARERLAAAIDSAKASCAKLEVKARARAKAADEVIRDHRYQTIGIALGAGLLIGVLVARK